MTPVQIEKTTIGLYPAIGLAVFCVGITITGALAFGRISNSIETIKENQEEAQDRAEARQADLEGQIQEVTVVGRDRNMALETRIRPLETQAAVAAATLQSINTNLLQLGADIRDLRESIRGADEPDRTAPR